MKKIKLIATTKLFIVAALLSSFILTGCGQDSSKQKEIELRERELALREKELYLDSVQNAKIEKTNSSNNNTPKSESSKSVAEKSSAKQKTNDREKFIGTFTWHGECPRGCAYTHIFKQNGTVETTFQASNFGETYTENWSLNEKDKVIKMVDKNGTVKYYYKFKGDNIVLTSCEYPLDKHEMSREK